MTIRGVVGTRRDAVVRLRVRGPGGDELELAALVDTGFTGALSLAVPTVVALRLSKASARTVQLGDGSRHRMELYEAEVEWGGGWRSVLVYAMGREALVGMRLLAGHQLRIDVVPGGAVEVTPLP